jgi:hypothetical protein
VKPTASRWIFGFWAWVILSLIRPVQSTDLWWQLASGRYMTMHRLIPTVDVFSLTCRDHRWVNFEWLNQLLFYASYRVGGLWGVTTLKIALITGALAFMIRRLRLAGVPEFGACGCAVVAFAACIPGWSERADLISIVLATALAHTLEGIRRGRLPFRRLWIWGALFPLWANAHAGFIIGLGMAALYLIDFIHARRVQSSPAIVWLFLMILSTLINPYGFTLWKQIAHTLTLVPRASQSEFLPPPWAHMPIFWMAFTLDALLCVRLLERRVKLPWIFWALTSAFGYEAIRHARFVPFFMLIAFPFVIEYSLLEAISRPIRDRLDQPRWQRYAGLALAFMALAQLPRIGFGMDRRNIPVDVCDFVESQRLSGRFFNDYDFGSYWIWRFQGEPAVLIDGRSSTVAGYPELRQSIHRAQQGTPSDWQRFLDSYGLTAVLVGYPDPMPGVSTFAYYLPRDRWALVYWDDVAVLYLRRTAYPAARLKDLEFPCIDPDRAPDDLAALAAASSARRRCLENDVLRNRRLHPTSLRAQADEEALAHG